MFAGISEFMTGSLLGFPDLAPVFSRLLLLGSCRRRIPTDLAAVQLRLQGKQCATRRTECAGGVGPGQQESLPVLHVTFLCVTLRFPHASSLTLIYWL